MTFLSTYQGRKSLLAQHLVSKNQTATGSEGLTTLINKVADIQYFSDGLLLYADKSIAQSGDTVNLYSLLLDDTKPLGGEDILFRGLLKSTATSRTLNSGEWTLVGDKYEITTLKISFSFSSTSTLWIGWDSVDEEYYFTTGSKASGVIDSGNLHDFSVENGIISYYKDSTLKTYDASGKNLNRIKCSSSGCVINDYGVYGTTGSNGVATYQYSCTGVGKVDFSAVCGSIQSEPYTLWDTYQYDNGNDSTHNIWDTPYQCTLTYGSEYAEITESTEYGFIRSNTAFPKDCTIEFDYYNHDGASVSNIFQIQTSANGYVTVMSMQYLGLSSGNWYHLKMTIEDGVLKVYKDNATTPVYTYPSSGSMSIATDTIKFLIMTVGATTKVRFKNFKIYPV